MKEFDLDKKTPNGKAKGQAVTWKVSDEGKTLVLQSKGEQWDI